MPIKVVAVPKPEFEKWLVEAKQKFASGTPEGEEPQPAKVAAVNTAAN